MIRPRHSLIPFYTAMLCVAVTVCLAGLAAPASARVLLVGPGRPLKLPSQAAALAQRGDTVRIDPGVYQDCSVWRASGLTILGASLNVVVASRTCLDQAIFVIYGNDITVQGITFRDATVPGRNGAAIKALGDNLTVRNSRFEHNENGILTGGSPASTIRIQDSTFVGNGACIFACAHAVYAGPVGMLDVERSVFLDTRTAHHIKSRAHRTIVRDCRIEDGPTGTSSYLIETPIGGDLLVEHNVLEKGPNSSNHDAAISIGAEGVANPTASLVVRDNMFRNDLPQPTTFVRNGTQTPAQLTDNKVSGQVRMLEGPGSVSP